MENFVQFPPYMTRHTADLLQSYKLVVHVMQPVTLLFASMASRRKRSSSVLLLLLLLLTAPRGLC